MGRPTTTAARNLCARAPAAEIINQRPKRREWAPELPVIAEIKDRKGVPPVL
jgi:hypothetical protein